MTTFIKALTTDDETQLFNLERVLNITPYGNGTAKILMGAGLYWTVYAESVEIVDCTNDLIKEINGGF